MRIPAEWIEHKDKLDPATALTWENVEQRRCAAEIIGWAKILDHLGGRIIQSDHDPYVGELIEVDLPDSPNQRFVRYQCGTGRTFASPVPPEYTTALEANAAIQGIHPKVLRMMQQRT